MTWNDVCDRKIRHGMVTTSCLQLWLLTDGAPQGMIVNVRPVLEYITFNTIYSTLQTGLLYLQTSEAIWLYTLQYHIIIFDKFC